MTHLSFLDPLDHDDLALEARDELLLRVHQLIVLLTEQNREEARRQLHSLKGVAAAFHYTQVAEAIHALEERDSRDITAGLTALIGLILAVPLPEHP